MNRKQITENSEQRAMGGSVAGCQDAQTVNHDTAHCSLLIVICSLFTVICFLLSGCASWGAPSAEEYFAIGMAYYDMGKYAEAEKWLNRARSKKRTMVASEYNLGRIAFETGSFSDAIRHFDGVLKRDPENVLALKAAAYTRIKSGDINGAAKLYDRLLALVPEDADDGYNYALVLFAMERYAEAETVLKNHEFALLDNNDNLLLYARTQKAQGKPEAIDTYANWLGNNSDPKISCEYAELLESEKLYARALEEYRSILNDLAAGSVDPSKPDIRYAIARILLVADSDNAEGITELRKAVEDGLADSEKMEELLTDERISAARKEEVRAIITEMIRAAEVVVETTEAEAPVDEPVVDEVSE